MGLKHVVITSVTRDDLPDGGASVFADTVRRLRDRIAGVTIEVLIPDFQGDEDSLMTVLNSHPDVLNHNVETVPRLYPSIRPQAIYTRSLELLKRASDYNVESTSPNNVGAASCRPLIDVEMSHARPPIVKSGIMVGLGETAGEVEELLRDLRTAGCTVVTIGQYLRPSRRQTPVKEYIPPEQFAAYEKMALEMGFAQAFCGAYVRSSYRAGEMISNAGIASSLRSSQ
jgi:lipoic acid synthetase